MNSIELSYKRITAYRLLLHALCWMILLVSLPSSLFGQQLLADGVYGQMLYPYAHEYDQTLCYKIGMDYCPESDRRPFDASEVLEIIRRVDNLTRGIPKIVYLVGWQYTGHDTGYPSFSTVNETLKRAEDESALESLRWIMRSARRHNTVVSLHVNFSDVYLDDNTLGPFYQERDIIVRETDGRHRQGYAWCDHMAYRASNYRNWYQGTFQHEQIDPLFEMIPELAESGTLHPDAWYNTNNPYYQVNDYEDCHAMREMTVYVRKKYDVDLTTEFDLGRPAGVDFVLYHPMIWHLGWNRTNPPYPMKIPSYFITGGDAYPWGSSELTEINKFFGHSATLESEINEDPVKIPGGLRSFATETLPWYYLNRHLRAAFRNDTAFYSHDLMVTWPGKRLIRKGAMLLQDGDDVFIPALWKSHKEIIAYSREGYSQKSWTLPVNWSDIRLVDMYDIHTSGLKLQAEAVPVSRDRKIRFSLEPDRSVSIVPSGTDPFRTMSGEPSGSVRFIGTDTQTCGNWKDRYGSAGYVIIGDENKIPENVDIRFVNGNVNIWNTGTDDIQALQKASQEGRIAASRSHGLHELIDVGFHDSLEHSVSLYFLDWDRKGRWSVVDVIDPVSRKLLHSINLTDFYNGRYLMYRITGNVAFRITNVWTQRYSRSTDAGFSGIFLDD